MERLILEALRDAGVQLNAEVRISRQQILYIPPEEIENIVTQNLSRSVSKELLKSRKGILESRVEHHTGDMRHRLSLYVFTPQELSDYAHKLVEQLQGINNGNTMDVSRSNGLQSYPSIREEDRTPRSRIRETKPHPDRSYGSLGLFE